MLGFRPDGEGLNISRMLSAPRHAYILHGIEPELDIADSGLAEAALKSADVVIALTAFADEALLDCCNIVLPIATFAETPGTFVNAEGRWQSFGAAASPYADSRPAWRILRVLATALGVSGCEYQHVDEIRAELESLLGQPAGSNRYAGAPELDLTPLAVDLEQIDIPMYSVDALVRRSAPLQQTAIARARRPA
jgi:NADH-quinone oxidoreductase subunit G